MNYKLVNIIKNVSSFEIDSLHRFFLIDNILFHNNKQLLSNVESFRWVDQKVILISENSTKILAANGQQITSIPKTILYTTLSKGSAIFSSNLNFDKLTLHFELLSIETNSILLNIGELSFEEKVYRHKDFILHHNTQLIHCYDIKRQKLLWKQYQEDLNISMFNAFLGVLNNKLFIACKENTILEINLKTGEISRSWKELPGFQIGNEYQDIIPSPNRFNLDLKQEKLIGTFDTFYIEIDLKSGKTSYLDLKEELQSHHISDFRPFSDHPFDDNYIYLTTHTYHPEYPGVDLGSVVALNRVTFKIGWMHTFTDTGIGTNTPKVTNTHLYQRDTEKNLYVFEKIIQEA